GLNRRRATWPGGVGDARSGVGAEAEDAVPPCRPVLMNARQSTGVKSIATTYEQASDTDTVIGRVRMNSPVEPGSRESGRNDAMMVNVAVRTGTARSLAERQAASERGTPSSRSST